MEKLKKTLIASLTSKDLIMIGSNGVSHKEGILSEIVKTKEEQLPLISPSSIKKEGKTTEGGKPPLRIAFDDKRKQTGASDLENGKASIFSNE